MGGCCQKWRALRDDGQFGKTLEQKGNVQGLMRSSIMIVASCDQREAASRSSREAIEQQLAAAPCNAAVSQGGGRRRRVVVSRQRGARGRQNEGRTPHFAGAEHSTSLFV